MATTGHAATACSSHTRHSRSASTTLTSTRQRAVATVGTQTIRLHDHKTKADRLSRPGMLHAQHSWLGSVWLAFQDKPNMGQHVCG
jgi:hypothetical protein